MPPLRLLFQIKITSIFFKKRRTFKKLKNIECCRFNISKIWNTRKSDMPAIFDEYFHFEETLGPDFDTLSLKVFLENFLASLRFLESIATHTVECQMIQFCLN